MRILAIDVGVGTQEILLFDTSRTIENCVKMVMPSPTTTVAKKIEGATARSRSLLLTGVTMGGGPCGRALRKHLEAGLGVYATPEAARTFDDDLAKVEELGVVIVATEEAERLRRETSSRPRRARSNRSVETLSQTLRDVEQIEMRDLDLDAIRRTLVAFGVAPHFDGVAVAVLDHGAAPPGVSDRLFRFEHVRRTLEQQNDLIAFAYLAEELPPYLTRMKAVAQSLDADLPLLLFDTPPAAVLGAMADPEVARHSRLVVVNLGNAHTLAFHLRQTRICGLFEHHTRLMSVEKLDSMIGRIVSGSLTNEEVFGDGGHGCFLIEKATMPLVVVTGPHRRLMASSKLGPYFAVPYGDMMLAGCFGLVRAFARRMEAWRDEIEGALAVEVAHDGAI